MKEALSSSETWFLQEPHSVHPRIRHSLTLEWFSLAMDRLQGESHALLKITWKEKSFTIAGNRKKIPRSCRSVLVISNKLILADSSSLNRRDYISFGRGWYNLFVEFGIILPIYRKRHSLVTLPDSGFARLS
jgi:hypothetical protein